MGAEFITAEWKNLVVISYKAPVPLLKKHLPPGLEIDLRDGDSFISIVAFDFKDTRLMGSKLPFIHTFPEINLRFYVCKGDKRGVVFIREFVPYKIISIGAKLFYNEPYMTIKMKNIVTIQEKISVTHDFTFEGNDYFINLTAENKPYLPDNDSIEKYFKEHSHGFGKTKSGKLLQYEVYHPEWEVFPVLEYEHNINFGKIYGEDFAFLNDCKPFNVLYAKGSHIKIYTHT